MASWDSDTEEDRWKRAEIGYYTDSDDTVIIESPPPTHVTVDTRQTPDETALDLSTVSISIINLTGNSFIEDFTVRHSMMIG